MDDVVIVIRYNGRFVMNEVEGNWEYLNGKNKARLIKTNCTHKELQEIVYDVTNVDRDNYHMIMKYIFYSAYKLDPIEIEDDGDVQCFIKEQLRVDSGHRSPIYIELSPRVVQRTERETSVSPANAFVSGRGSNHCSSTIPAPNMFNNPITSARDEIPTIPRTNGCGSSPINLADENNVIPTPQEYENEVNVNEEGVDVNYEVHEEETQQCAGIHEDYIEAYDRVGVEVPIVSPVGEPVDDPIGLDTEVPHGSLPGENHIQSTGQHQHHHTPREYNERVCQTNIHSSTSTFDPTSTTHSISSTSGEIEVGQTYTNKRELQRKLSTYVMKMKFEYKVHKSCSRRFEVKCVDDNCKWRLRATRIDGFDFFAVRKFIDTHTCSKVNNLNPNHRQATCGFVGDDIMPKYDGIARVYRPKDIVFDIKHQYGVDISYEKAWRAREHALKSLRGSPEDSFKMLPVWCWMLEKNNPGTITRIETDSDNTFLYCFMALGQSRAGFNKVRPVVAVDGTHLKGKYKGTLYVAACFDGNEQIFPLAFGIGDTENESSYTWFFERFKEAYGEVDDLVFITDRHKGLERAIAKVYPTAHHGHCMYHLSCNVKQHFGQNKHVHMAFYLAAKSYLQTEFDMYMNQLRAIDIRAFQYVIEAMPYKWARSHFPGNRYSIMTTNIAECMNAVLRDARSLPIVLLLESIRQLIQGWFYDRRNEAAASTTDVTPWLEKILNKQIDQCVTMQVTPLNSVEFHVRGIEMSAKVNLETRSCSCREFDLNRYPCIHAVAACRLRNISCYSLCSEYYSKSSWLAAYSHTIYPLDDVRFWDPPQDIRERVVLPPNVRRAPGRPRTKRIPSRGENQPKRRCATCGVLGHNRRTCSGNH